MSSLEQVPLNILVLTPDEFLSILILSVEDITLSREYLLYIAKKRVVQIEGWTKSGPITSAYCAECGAARRLIASADTPLPIFQEGTVKFLQLALYNQAMLNNAHVGYSEELKSQMKSQTDGIVKRVVITE